MGTVEYQDRYRIVWIHEEQVYGTILSEGAHVSLVRYSKDAIDYSVYLENDEFTLMDEIGFMHIEEDDEDNLL